MVGTSGAVAAFGAADSAPTFGSLVGSSGGGGGGFGAVGGSSGFGFGSNSGGAPSSPPPAGTQFSSWR